MFEHFTEHAKRVLELEGIEAQKMHAAYLGTEHLLLALVREPEGHGHRAMEKLGVSRKQLKLVIDNLAGQGPQSDLPDCLHQTPRVKHVMAAALEEARKLKHNHIGTEHLLLSLLCEPEGIAMKALAKLGITPEQVRNEVLAMLDEEQKDAKP